MSRSVETTLTDAAAKNLSVSATLEWLADMELEARKQRAIERRYKCSRLQAQPSIDAFQFQHHKTRQQAKSRILRLLDLEFLASGTNPGAHRQSWRAQDLPGEDHRLARLSGQSARALHHRHGHAQPPAGFASGSLPGSQAENLHRADAPRL
jgi:hypothetical protein